jgi:leader peptidase (prepilin peptidase) / N-methyltransferase
MLDPVVSPDAADWLIAAWLFVMGGIIGSFLNVVVYRLPAGISIVSPGSHCPACKKPIRWFDNMPVLGWLWLGGRCRDCHAAISPRYPLVEAGTAVLFLVIGLADYYSCGVRLLTETAHGSGELVLSTSALAHLLGIWSWHLLLLCTLLCAALMDYDRQRPPLRLFLPALAVGLAASPLWPALHRLPAWPGGSGWAAGLRDGAVGLAAGLLLGLSPPRSAGLLLGTACVGLYLGWQAVGVLALATLVIHRSFWALGRSIHALQRIPATAWLTAATLAWILAWAL